MVSPNPGLLAALLKTGRLNGVVRWKVVLDVETLSKESEAAGWRSLVIDSHGARSLEQFLQISSSELNLGTKASESIADWEEAFANQFTHEHPACVMWIGWQELVKVSPVDAEVIVSICEDILKDTAGLILIAGHQGTFPKVDELALA